MEPGKIDFQLLESPLGDGAESDEKYSVNFIKKNFKLVIFICK